MASSSSSLIIEKDSVAKMKQEGGGKPINRTSKFAKTCQSTEAGDVVAAREGELAAEDVAAREGEPTRHKTNLQDMVRTRCFSLWHKM